MHSRLMTFAFLTLGALCVPPLYAQSAQPTDAAPAAVDRLFRIGGVVPSTPGAAAGAMETIAFAIYDSETGGTVLWQELQTVPVDSQGHYNVLLGSTNTAGLPLELFATSEPRWLATRVQREGQPEQPRSLLTSVPYALRAATASDADTLGGRPASSYLLAPSAGGDSAAAAGAASSDPLFRDPGPLVNNGTTGFIGKFFNTVDLDNSALFQSGSNIGLGTTAPLDALHTQFLNTAGSATGYAVQNLGNTTASYSGMLFYDHTGALRQFQGYNNGTGEYRINNISPTGSINFMIGSNSAFRVNNNRSAAINTAGTFGLTSTNAAGQSFIEVDGTSFSGYSYATANVRKWLTFIDPGTAEFTFRDFDTGGDRLVFDGTSAHVKVSPADAAGKLMIGPISGGSALSGNIGVAGDGSSLQGVAMFDRLNDDGTLVRFRRNGATQGTIDVVLGVVSYNAFTGSHYARTDEVIERGMLVSLTGNNGRLEDNPQSEILYGVTKSQRANDPAIMGAYLARQNATAANLSNSVNPHLVEAVGNGEMWVIDTGRNLVGGDYLVSSAVAGHAMTDPGTFAVSNIVARLAAPIDWATVTETVQGADGRAHKRALASVFFESFVIDRTRNSATDAELVSLRTQVADLTTQLAAVESMLKTLTTAVQQQQQR